MNVYPWHNFLKECDFMLLLLAFGLTVTLSSSVPWQGNIHLLSKKSCTTWTISCSNIQSIYKGKQPWFDLVCFRWEWEPSPSVFLWTYVFLFSALVERLLRHNMWLSQTNHRTCYSKQYTTMRTSCHLPHNVSYMSTWKQQNMSQKADLLTSSGLKHITRIFFK